MRTAGILLIVFGSLFAISRGAYRLYVHYQYSNSAECNWDLSERASTIKQKSEYMNKFVKALEKYNLDGVNNAIFFPTPESDFSENLKALKSLQQRLIDISLMDESSLAYQTAIQQITSQEQREARSMIDNLRDCWTEQYHYTCWNELLGMGFITLQFLMIAFGIVMIDND